MQRPRRVEGLRSRGDGVLDVLVRGDPNRRDHPAVVGTADVEGAPAVPSVPGNEEGFPVVVHVLSHHANLAMTCLTSV